jgi:rhomboid protease GluP
MGACASLYVLMLLMSARTGRLEPIGGMMTILAPDLQTEVVFGASGYKPFIENGWWWTLLTASWLHGSFLHILFNMMWVRDLGSAAADVVGPSRTVIIYTVSGACGFLLSSLTYGLAIPIIPGFLVLHGGYVTLGASASIFGLLGALWHYGRTSGSSYIRAQAGYYAAVLFVMGLAMPGVDNFAHAGGFIGGYATSALFNPMKRERGDHLILVIACLVATLLAFVYHAVTVVRIVNAAG